jgi:EpsI family protein
MKRAAIIATVVILVAGVTGNLFRFGEVKADRGANFAVIPMSATGFTGTEHFFDSASYGILKADTSTLRLYLGESGSPLWLFVAYFASQKYGSQIHSPKRCLPGSGWRIDSNQPYQFTTPSGATREINRLVISDGKERQLMLYWFETRTGAIRNEFGLKFDLVKNSLSFNPTDAAIVRLNLPLEPSDTIDSATRRALDFLALFYQPIEKALPFSS